LLFMLFNDEFLIFFKQMYCLTVEFLL